jgi:hypothetical protein
MADDRKQKGVKDFLTNCTLRMAKSVNWRPNCLKSNRQCKFNNGYLAVVFHPRDSNARRLNGKVYSST